MKQQLTNGNLDLQHATYYARDQLFDNTEDKTSIIESQFPDRVIDENLWDWGDVQDTVANDFEKNEYFIVESKKKTDDEVFNADGLRPNDVVEWRDSFRQNKPLFVFDSEFAGLYLPRFDSFVSKLAPFSIMIAPTAYPSKELVKAFVCNLGKYKNLGEAFRQARNNYYWGVDTEDEFVGLAMLSYSLYGLPYLTASLPNYDEDMIEDYCENYLKDFKKEAMLQVTIMGKIDIFENELLSLIKHDFLGLKKIKQNVRKVLKIETKSPDRLAA